MTNFDKFKNMTVEEFAKTRVTWNGEFDTYANDINTYSGNDEEKAIQDEIEWLNTEIEVCPYCKGTKVIMIYGREETPEECPYCKNK